MNPTPKCYCYGSTPIIHHAYHDDLAARIKEAVHAGVVKQMSKEMEETARYEWEDENTGIMKDLIIQKAKT